MSTETQKLRNFSLVGHGGTGKTSLFEQILFQGKVILKAERVESGRTVSDFAEDEIARGLSIHTALGNITWKGTKLNIFDTPGASDFSGEVISAFRASESAVLVVGARSGVQIETLKLWRFLESHSMPRMVFINKVDKAASDFWQTLDDLQEKFSVPFIPVSIPMGHDEEHRGVINLLENCAYFLDASGQGETQSEIPSEFQKEAEKARLNLIEEAAEGDEELLEKYAATDTLSDDEIKQGLRQGLARNQFVPVFCGSALLNSGIVALLDFIAADSPSPFHVVEPCASGEKERQISPEGEFSGLVFKTVLDQFAGRLSFIKVVTGRLSHGTDFFVPRLGKSFRAAKIFTCQGKKLQEVAELSAGDLGILAKLDELKTNDSLCPGQDVIHYLPLELPRPVHAITIAAKAQRDEDKLNQILVKEAEQNPTFQVAYNHDTKETIISSMGDLSLAILLDKIRNAKIDFLTRLPKISYRETITRSAEAEYTHKKQTGGHGQYAKVFMDFHPLPRGEGFAFSNTLKGQNVSKGYLPAVEKGVQEAMLEGFLAGFPLIDLKANLSDGKEHPVDSSELAFKLAARGAFREALAQAHVILLEPIMMVSLFVEEKYLGDILADISGKRGRVLGQESFGKDIVVVKAQIPHAEMLQYALSLKALTSGTGAFEMEFDHFSPLGSRETELLVKDYQAHRKNDVDS